MVFVHLSDEQKLQVLLLGLALFAGALLAAVCLAASCCPLNRWLLERASKRRRQLLLGPQLQPPAYAFGAALAGAKGAPPGPPGPPPAYEAALRVSRLQSLTGALPPLEPDKAPPLDFGDYFHQPREPAGPESAPALPAPDPQAAGGPPVLLRLWVRLMEPGELIARARGLQQSGEGSAGGSSRGSCQLSIPHLLGSLVTLARQRSQSQETLASEPAPPENSDSLASTDSGHSLPAQPEPEPRPAHSATLTASPVTSRVLHMNVASFSYVKDEALISTKRHNQMNFHHFRGRQSGRDKAGGSKMCQLVISVCDVENLLGAARLGERSCALLANSSAIYIQCEILAAKSKAGRLLSYPLRALHAPQSSHTLNFGASIPAAAMERHTVISVPAESGGTELSGKPELTRPDGSDGPAKPDKSAGTGAGWRHEPAADGKSIVVFSSVPKQVAQQQQLAAASLGHQEPSQPDMIQFDSVFVSPILARAAVAEAHLRLRIFSTCRYVNESCLAELKLPLRRLLDAPDNLADAGPEPPAGRAQQQADFILNNLLANLVTAASGAPLSTLIERISQEEAAVPEEAARSQSFRLAPSLWRERELRATHSLGGSLYRLPALERRRKEEAADELELERRRAAERERRVEQNYCRSLMVSHWLNYLVAPAYRCAPVEERRGELILGLTYLPTSNRVVFNAHRAALAGALGRQVGMKSLRLQTSTCYLVRLFMVLGGRVLRRKQTPPSRKLEWDSQEPITFDLASVGAQEPSFVAALVTRSAAGASGSLQNLRACSCHSGAHSDGELEAAKGHELSCAIYRPEGAEAPGERPSRDLVIGHLVLAEQIWRELRAKPRKQIVRPFKLY